MDLVDLNYLKEKRICPSNRRDPYGSRGSKSRPGIIKSPLFTVEILMDLVDLNILYLPLMNSC